MLRYDGIGDMVLTSGMLRELRRLLPEARITLVCRSSWAPWMRTCPWVDGVEDLDLRFPVRFYAQRRLLQMLGFARRRLWPLELEVLLQPGTFHWYFDSRALAWLSGAPVRMGWEDPDWGQDTCGGLLTHRLPLANACHESEKCFRLLEAMGLEPSGRRLEAWWTRDDGESGAAIAHEARAGRRKLVALGLAGSEPQKRWPAGEFLEAMRDIAARHDAAFLVLGGEDVWDTCRWLAARAPQRVHMLPGHLPLGAVWAAIARCDLYVGNDTGLMHMASAARVPTVVVNGLPEGARPGTRGDPLHTGPVDTPSRTIRPSGAGDADGGMRVDRVSHEPVAAAALELLG